MVFLLQMTSILGMERKDTELVSLLTDKYKIDYQILVVNQERIMAHFLLKQSKFTQILTPETIENTTIDTSQIVKLGYFLFLQDDVETKKVLSKFDPVMFKRYSWFIESCDLQNTLDMELEFDMDINLLCEKNSGIDINELYGLQGKVISRKFGRFFDNIFSSESLNKLERRNNLMGQTFR